MRWHCVTPRLRATSHDRELLPYLPRHAGAQAKDRSGKDLYTRRQNVLPEVDGEIDWEKLMTVDGKLPDVQSPP